MAMDGSFSIQSALERFLARCPNLQSLRRFDSLVKKGDTVTEEEVVKAVADVFLLPSYTIPLIGCFRAIATQIVDKAVELLRFVPNLRFNSDDSVAEFGEDRILNESSVIEFYNGVGKGLDLHELACLAFCRALDLAPFLLGSVLNYFKYAPPPFGRLLLRQTISELCEKVWSHLLLAVRTSYRFLLLQFDTFFKLWDWSCFLDLSKQRANFGLCSSTNNMEVIVDIRWCVIQIISLILNLSDRTTTFLGISDEEGFSCLLRWEDFCQDVALEKASWYIELSEPNKSGSVNGSYDLNLKSCLHSSSMFSSVYMEPPIRSQRHATWDYESSGNPFVLTSTVKKSFEMVLLAVSQKCPVLLYGPTGCGKSSLVSNIAQNSGNQVLSIHMDDQIDGKTLVGSYVCTERPGEFRWQPGSLTQAVLHGYWVVFEDIDKAPSDVHSILLPLLEGANSFVTGHGEEIRVAETFRLFSTISTSKLDVSSITEGGNSLSSFWRRVMVGPPNIEDLQNIVEVCYPSLKPLAEKLIETYGIVNSALSLHAGFQPGNSASANYLSRFSLRDLLKWCKRIVGMGFSFIGNEMSAYECDCIYQEAVDIFAAFSISAENRLTMRKEIAKLWAVPATVTETLYPPNKPVIKDLLSELRIGRVSLQRTQTTLHTERKSFVEIRSSLHLLERLAASVKGNEPVLLVGETGTGKTTLVQDLALRLGQRLTVLNLSQQSDVADLLGGFKPMDAQFICFPLYKEFEDLFSKTFSVKANFDFLSRLQKYLTDKKWKMLLRGFQKGFDFFQRSVEEGRSVSGKKRKKPLEEEKIKAWENFSLNLETARQQIAASSGMIFSFVEGAFVTALKNGEWILLDEVNLAPPETLQRVTGVLEGESGSLCLVERGDVSHVRRHPNFRLFACMNPATDAGKRDLPFSIRSRFTEYFVDDVLDDEDLTLFVNQFLGDNKSDSELVNKIVRFYKAVKKDSEERLQDGANQKPQYSLRSLYRALEYTRKSERSFGFQKAIYDGFCMFFQTLLDRPSAKIMDQMILSYLLGGKIPRHVPFDGYLNSISTSNEFTDNYILTRSVREHLSSLARAIWIKKYPVLLQGPTSSGKTSLVRYLAAITGHEFVRINNHEHTDLQEYLGSYITDAGGKLVFHEGVLVKAIRNGYWIVLDELNLAPSDVLEALNRLLDDNRELFVPELQETIRPHPDFMLFATQNPPTFYGGRKMLSRAFRNRFIEIHVDEIPEDELSTIIENRCKIPESYARKMVEVMKELQLNRQRSKVFAGKHGFITPRDLFRWADRFRKLEGRSYEDLARDGYFLLAERLRDEGEKHVVQEVLEKHLRVKLLKDDLYKQESVGQNPVFNFTNGDKVLFGPKNVIWTKSMQRLYFLVERCHRVQEPVLLVGETGGGKTTVCQLLSILLGSKLHILNCHQYTETSDFLGGFYPIRERSRLMLDFKKIIEEIVTLDTFDHFHPDFSLSSDISQASSTLYMLEEMMKTYKKDRVSCPGVTDQDLRTLEVMVANLSELHQKWQTIFMWQDGPLVQAMRDGDLFLVDEISLADDSVLERLNSVLEPERTLSLAEKGGSELEKIVAHPNFFLLGTMNPGGDFGKKELSPALRNRFTEIWVPPVDDSNELKSIALRRLFSPKLSYIVDPMLSFWEWFSHLQTGRMLTVRDLLSWIDFINVTESRLGPEYAVLHGMFLVLLDGLSLGTGISKRDAEELRKSSLSFFLEQLKVGDANVMFSKHSTLQNYGWGDLETSMDTSLDNKMQCDNIFGVDPFYIEKGCENCKDGEFEIFAPTTCRNALRVLRAMQLPKPVLLEGSPGVGKTSLIVALGKFSGHKVVRINLSEQTDIMDLLGSDLPVESEDGIKFAWSDGILLQALKEGCWVLLDELNLAPQSVLEGLNAILDHRAEVFIPELGYTFKCPSSFKIFACQNPSYQGGGRKGLPKSFLNRFTKVYVDELVQDDYLFICGTKYPSISRPLLSKLILFNKQLYEETMLYHKFAQDGSPWEFNLRDIFRSCQIIQGSPEKSKNYCFLDTVYVQRMRTESDRRQVLQLYEQIFEEKPYINPYPRVQLNSQYFIVGNTAIRRNNVQSSKIPNSPLKILPGICNSLEAAAQCLEHEWLCILIGPASSGKTSLIRLLAQLTGNVINELHLSSGTDISEILGCFEQYNAFRKFRFIVAQVECYINEYCSLQLETFKEPFLSEGEGFMTKWLAFLCSMNNDFVSCFTSMHVDDRKRFVDSLSMLIKIIQELKLVQEKNNLSLPWSSKELDKIVKTTMKLQEDHEKRSFSVKFEWITGLLIKAVERGEWIVLENANCCNPTVLDRINSLVEPSGSITINECGIVDGKPVVLHPHPNFRMFLTVNPKYGEVSRAMRNRGVEIFLMQPNWLLDDSCGYSCDDIALNDVKRFLVLSGIPFGKLVHSMAKSHIYAREEGLRFNISITYLELARWVQLFQQLIMNGNQPLWSLQTSWEHIYYSSLGVADGGSTISHVKHAYLSVMSLSESGSSLASSLCLPGGWPMPLKLRDFVFYSKETSVKRNCSYLEFLAAQCASYELSRCSVYQDSTAGGFAGNYLMDIRMLHQIMFPKAFNMKDLNIGERFDLELAKKKLWFAANWTIEQATGSDFELYFLWFRWFGSRLQPLAQVFDLFKLVVEHPIWKYLTYIYRQLYQVDFEKHPIPILSLEFVDGIEANDRNCKFLQNAISCIGPLKLTYQQWSDESKHYDCEEAQHFIPVLSSLRLLEEELLNKLVETSSFNALIQLYADLLEDHILFWNGVMSSDPGKLLISWRSLLKKATKLKVFSPEAVDNLLRNSKNLDTVCSLNFHLEKPLLWVNGGHPVLPSSACLFKKQLQLLKFCELVWPSERELSDTEDDCMIGVVASSDSEFRFLVLEGISMLSSITGKFGYDEEEVLVQQLEDIYEKLEKRFKQVKRGVEKKLGCDKFAVSEANSSACCSYSTETLCQKSGFDSWQETLPLIDITSFSLDMELLQKLSSVVLVDSKGLQQALSDVSTHLESALNFSLAFSSRPPQMFLPHQKLLWILDAWTLVDTVDGKISSFLLEMWFRWHQSLWIYVPASVKNFSREPGYDIPVPDVLVCPVMMATNFQMLQNTIAIKDYHVGSLKIRVASLNLWHSLSPGAKLPSFLLSAACYLFEQIISAHRKAFDAEKFSTIKSILCDFQINTVEKESVKLDNMHHMRSLILSSSHQRLKESVDMFIEPLLEELYLRCSSTDPMSSLGRVWLCLGGLRLNLLLGCGDLDPSMKYNIKYTRLAERITLLKLEMQVRKECDYLAGWTSTREADKQRAQELENLEKEQKRLQRKMVFRSDHGKFKALKSECDEFLGRVKFSKFLWGNIKAMSLQQILDEGCNWQKIATSFIETLAEKYTDYIDFIQPVQVAVYEIKLGLALVISSVMQKAILSRFKMDNINAVVETIYSFMRFPWASVSKTISVNMNSEVPEFPSCELEIAANFDVGDIDLLEKLFSFSSEVMTEKMVSDRQLKVSLYKNFLIRIAHSVANVRLIDSASLRLLDMMFHEFSNFWMRMKIQAKTKEDYDSQLYKFRPRILEIENIIELDISMLGKSLANENFLEWKELHSVDEDAVMEEASKEQENSEEDWNLVEESIVNSVVHIHNQLFGLNSFSLTGSFHISDVDRLLSFTDSYMLGIVMVEGFRGSFLSGLDAQLAPEHLLRLCLEHELKFISSCKSSQRYNFYKDSNASEMSKMVKVLAPLQYCVHSLLNEREDDHGLLKISNVIEMLLNMPLSTPLAKVLSGLHFLVNCVRVSQENGSKVSASDQLEPILALMSSWQKMEFESWPALLDEVQDQYDINAGKLWFPLYSVLRHRCSSDLAEYNESTTLSLEEFIYTSSIGEFRKRLELLFAFLGQINMGIRLKFYSSACETENLKILYNVFGYYVQFLPATLEHIETRRRNIEGELKELLKLCSWERPESFLSIENFKRKRQKLRKLIQKYTDLLQEPVMIFLNQETALKRSKPQSQHGQESLIDFVNRNVGMMDATFNQKLLNDEDRFMWYPEWRENSDCALRNFQLDVSTEFDVLYSHYKDIFTEYMASRSSGLLYQAEWQAVWCKVERIFRTALDCGEIWKDEKKSQGKRRALSDLLKLLESSGLSRHKPIYMKDQIKSWWFLQPSYDLRHLPLTQSRLMCGASDVADPNKLLSFPSGKLVTQWATANEYYFKSVASLLLLQQICLNCNKDIMREQVDRSCSFLHHLVEIQQKQQATAIVFSKNLKRFKKCVSILKLLYSNSTNYDDGNGAKFSIIKNQDGVIKCMWQQKQLFDSLYSISNDELVLLKKFETTHLSTCKTVKAASNRFIALIEKFLPVFWNSKEQLDNNLLGQDRDITDLAAPPHLFVVSKEMEELISQNFLVIKEFKEHFLSLRKQDVNKSSVIEALFNHFEDLFIKARLVEEEFSSRMKEKEYSFDTLDGGACCRIYSDLNTEFVEAFKNTFEHVLETMQKLCSCNGQVLSDESAGNITSWEFLFDSLVTNLSLEHLCDKLLRTVSCAKKLVSECDDISCQFWVHFNHLNLLLGLLLDFSDGLLQEFLAMHERVSLMIHVLASILASLYSKGFGISAEDQANDVAPDLSQDAEGTGMGEGAGMNDVSDQITDEDQLLGASEKQGEEKDASGEAPSNNDKGIEMEQDFAADTFSVSEDSEEDTNEDGEEEQLDSAVGETGESGQVVDEKLWDKNEDENPNDVKEKYESGPSVTDKDASSRELRAKEDSTVAADEPGELDSHELDKSDSEIGNTDDLDDGENLEDMNLDKEEAFVDSTGLKLDEMNQSSEEGMDLDEKEAADSDEEVNPEVQDESAGDGNLDEEKPSPNDETMVEPGTDQLDANPEGDEPRTECKENDEPNLMGPKRDVFEPGSDDLVRDDLLNSESVTKPDYELQASDPRNVAPELNFENSKDFHNGLAPSRGLPSSNSSELDIMASESANVGKNIDGQPEAHLPQPESSSVRKSQPNPYRSVGDALKEWKERVNVSVDIQADDMDTQQVEIDDENANEFGYVSEFEKGTAQALGPAMSEQVDKNVSDNKPNEAGLSEHGDDLTKVEIGEQRSETHHTSGASIRKNKTEDQMNFEPDKLPNEELEETPSNDDGDSRGLSDSLVSVKKSYLREDIHQLSKLSIDDNDLGKAQDPGDNSNYVNDATALWRRYELLTTRLSQEMAEQLRLVMEPTMASKLQGDYKTGKRISMKKVIPYIASNYRKDKIWLRRTRPNKRDYQVVIAVDDSRSMSESGCGGVAIEALVTVCRAMSQLEMGNLAVASFGKKGNIRLLHDFDQPFTGEAGIKMISSLTFKQENTIADEPVVDLLKYLNKKLDTAVAKARLPSGQNPLEQLVLIIADGRFHEKERLKRCVRDVLSRKRMVAFLLLDSPQESIVDLMEASFQGGNIKFSKYLDSFPFPYYIVLKNIDALPRTLADLLRQWFELMQNSRE
ncbi:midasin isoform X2 [Ziziphus jujuba]|uniref:Midasin n=1 Tax=Ziziphus jujuba TaxID=326968 RepID=A0ABM3I984_ZIZJJ|nr:midasin isoform X2 [Ziziphus jujuba]